MKFDDMRLIGDALEVATLLEAQFPKVIFTSGRRNLEEQAQAMAENVIRNSNWIAETYVKSPASVECQEWVDNATRPLQLDRLKDGLFWILGRCTDKELSLLSKHLSGEAFDVHPVNEKWGIGVKAYLYDEAKKREGKFLEKEGGLTRWHWEAK